MSRDGEIVMQSKHNKQLVPLAKHLRKEMTKEDGIFGMTFCEHILSDFLGKRYWGNILRIFTVRKLSW